MFFFDGMVDSFTINESLVRPVLLSDRRRASADELAGRILQADDCRVETDMDKALAAFLYGDTLVLTEGDARALVVNTKGFARRSPEEPENERVLSGPREGFTECFMPNLALIRRRVRDTRLKFNFLRVGGRTNTAVCLCYIDGLCPAPLVDEMRTRLSVLELDSVLDANYIAECLCDHRFSPFPTLGTTERPDVAASRLLEGRCALVVDGSPVVLTAPHLLQECFQSNDDYYISFLRTNVSRVLRTLGFFCSVTIPAVYTALLLYHRELVPARLLFAITAAQRGVPLPVGWEVLLLLFVTWLLLRMRRLKLTLEEREGQLVVAREKAEESDMLKSAFLANMSHEIRTPLNAIVGFSSLMQNEQLSQEERAEYCAIVVSNSEMLLTLLNDILDISSLECGKIRFNYASEDIVQICQHVMMTTAHTRQRGVEGRFACPVGSFMLTTDTHRLSQILINLLTNAGKFTSEGSITLGVEIDEERGEVLFSVADTGPGIPPDKQDLVFNRFEKLDGNKKKGTGLGLAICRQIAMIVGGRIWVDSAYTGGTRFVFAHPIGIDPGGENREGGDFYPLNSASPSL
mgnify:CR=1 FL=1